MGILKRKEGDYYKGEFLNGKRHGFGEMKRGGVTYIGNFIEDVLDGWVNVLKEKREYKCFFENGLEDKNKSELIKWIIFINGNTKNYLFFKFRIEAKISRYRRNEFTQRDLKKIQTYINILLSGSKYIEISEIGKSDKIMWKN